MLMNNIPRDAAILQVKRAYVAVDTSKLLMQPLAARSVRCYGHVAETCLIQPLFLACFFNAEFCVVANSPVKPVLDVARLKAPSNTSGKIFFGRKAFDNMQKLVNRERTLRTHPIKMSVEKVLVMTLKATMLHPST